MALGLGLAGCMRIHWHRAHRTGTFLPLRFIVCLHQGIQRDPNSRIPVYASRNFHQDRVAETIRCWNFQLVCRDEVLAGVVVLEGYRISNIRKSGTSKNEEVRDMDMRTFGLIGDELGIVCLCVSRGFGEMQGNLEVVAKRRKLGSDSGLNSHPSPGIGPDTLVPRDSATWNPGGRRRQPRLLTGSLVWHHFSRRGMLARLQSCGGSKLGNVGFKREERRDRDVTGNNDFKRSQVFEYGRHQYSIKLHATIYTFRIWIFSLQGNQSSSGRQRKDSVECWEEEAVRAVEFEFLPPAGLSDERERHQLELYVMRCEM
ncbi:hypothetical protein B0J14DRAFT_633059 [Halenospora varia]|nr:hypothetical protein B0J14DRAFT_633059 [Halenospora varia]